MKKFLIFVFLCFALSSCLGIGGGKTSSPETGLREEKNDNFSMNVPASWDAVDLKTFPVPKLGEVVYALKSSEKRQDYYNNLVILKADRTQDVSSLDLLNASKQILRDSLESYTSIKSEEFNFGDGDKGKILTYSGRYNTDTPTLHYVQTAKICGDTSYFITLSVGEVLESYEKYEYILKSFTCK